jgi:sodium/potassium-transporting ATPase subunit alpha
MSRPPRARTERLLNGGLLSRAYLLLGPMEAVAAMAAYFFVLRGGGWRPGEALGSKNLLYLQATTACLSAIVVSQIVNVYLCRDARESILRTPLLGNRLIVAGIGAEIAVILLIVYTPVGNSLFGTAPIGAGVWLFTLPFAMAMLAIEEGRKAAALHSAAARVT